MVDVAALEDFPKLRGVEDSASAHEKARERIGDAQREAATRRSFEEQLTALKRRYEELLAMEDAQARG